MCKVSVLIPAYNVEPYIRECLDSVRNQTLSDLEVICVDDASTDETLSILREYEAKDPRIKVYCHEQNKGQSCGRNLALVHASGEYVYMLDADDMILPEALEELYQICARDRLDVAGFENRQFTEDGAFAQAAAGKTIQYEECPVMDGREALVYCMEKECFSLSVPTFIMKRAYLEAISLRFTEGILHEDVGYLFELISRASRVRFLHKVYFLRRIRARSTMTRGFTDANIEGYLKSFLRSMELEEGWEELYEEQPEFQAAVRKWQRDIYGRLRQIYLQWEESIYNQKGGHVDTQVRRMFQVLKLHAPGRARAEDILGKSLCRQLELLPEKAENGVPQVWICGMGQYAERMIDLIGTLKVLIRGILVTQKSREAFRGFPVYEVAEGRERSIPVILGVSHYSREEYETALEQAGYRNVLRVPF